MLLRRQPWTVLVPLAFLVVAHLSAAGPVGAAAAAQGLNDDGGDFPPPPPCALWLAPSTLFGREVLGVYSGRNVSDGAVVVPEDLNLPVLDANLHEKSPWHNLLWKEDVVHDLLMQGTFAGGAILPGALGGVVDCLEGYGNVFLVAATVAAAAADHSSGVHRSRDPAAGAFSYRPGMEFRATGPIQEGQELVFPCDFSAGPPSEDGTEPSPTRSSHWLRSNHAICLDNVLVRPSTVAPGRGAFAKNPVQEGETVASSPVALLHRAQTDIVHQFETSEDGTYARRGPVTYTEDVTGRQLLLNYAYGRPDSNVLVLPVGPGVGLINHPSRNAGGANVRVRWSESPLSDRSVLDLNAFEVLELEKTRLLVDYVALRDVEAGEELLMDYGPAWEEAWNEHVAGWIPPEGSEGYVSAADYVREHGQRLLTTEEQRENPYPENVITACFSRPCFWPCSLEERVIKEGKYFYHVRLHKMTSTMAPEHCNSPRTIEGRLNLFREESIYIVDDAYTDDRHLENAFRHEIDAGMPFPSQWMARDPNPLGDFVLPNLKPGAIEHVRWAESGEIVTPNAYLIGLPSQVRLELLKYCDRMGITEKFRDLTVRGNSLLPDQEEEIVLNGFNWFAQRPAA